jgi:Leucine-rich repeat (LRR) protein
MGLTEINEIPSYCKMLHCIDNNLTSLPPLPMKGTMTNLHCGNNQLTCLPELPDTLKELHCDNNNITILPDIPESVIFIHVQDNPLETNYPEIFKIGRNNDIMQIDKYCQQVIQYINRRNAMMRAKDRMQLIDPTNQLLERYMRRAMHPSRLQPLLDNTDLDVDEFMTQYTNSL